VRFVSGEAQAFPGFKYDQLTLVLEEELLKWLSANRGIHEGDVDVKLSIGERVLDTHKTFRDNDFTDGMEITAALMYDPDPPPALTSSSSSPRDWPYYQYSPRESDSSSQGSDFFAEINAGDMEGRSPFKSGQSSSAFCRQASTASRRKARR